MSVVTPYPHNPNMATPYPSPLPPNPLQLPLADYRLANDQFLSQGQLSLQVQPSAAQPQGLSSPFQSAANPAQTYASSRNDSGNPSLKPSTQSHRKIEPQFGFIDGGVLSFPIACLACCCCCPILFFGALLIAGAAAVKG